METRHSPVPTTETRQCRLRKAAASMEISASGGVSLASLKRPTQVIDHYCFGRSGRFWLALAMFSARCC